MIADVVWLTFPLGIAVAVLIPILHVRDTMFRDRYWSDPDFRARVHNKHQQELGRKTK